MIITPNYVYEFTFISQFNTLDGIYIVESIMSYAELLNNNIDLFKVTYKPNNVSDDVFKTDLDTIRAKRILKLKSVINDATIIYVPEHIFDKVPNGSVQKYLKLGLAVNLGIFDNISDMNVIKNEVDQIVSSMTGIQDKTAIFSVSNEWMTESDYATIKAIRDAAISRVSNHYTDKRSLLLEIDSLKTKIDYYENLIKSLQ